MKCGVIGALLGVEYVLGGKISPFPLRFFSLSVNLGPTADATYGFLAVAQLPDCPVYLTLSPHGWRGKFPPEPHVAFSPGACCAACRRQLFSLNARRSAIALGYSRGSIFSQQDTRPGPGLRRRGGGAKIPRSASFVSSRRPLSPRKHPDLGVRRTCCVFSSYANSALRRSLFSQPDARKLMSEMS